MGLVNAVFRLRKRLHEDELEKLINILEDERKRRGFARDNEVLPKRGFKNV